MKRETFEIGSGEEEVKPTEKELEKEADKILKEAGFTRSGRSKREVDYKQYQFEKSQAKTGFRGASRKGEGGWRPKKPR